MSVRREPDGDLVLPGTFPVHDLVDLGIDDVPEREADFTPIFARPI